MEVSQNLAALQIKFDLARRGFTQAQLARELGVTKSTISRVIGGQDRSGRVEARIVDIIGFDPFPKPAWRRRLSDGTYA